MQHLVTYPLVTRPHSPELVTKRALVRFATRAEDLGFDGIGFTDHPAPSHRWLVHGGHDALDPFVALGVVAGATERLRLIPNILVLPYRNPFLVAKAAATLEALSDGRFVLAVATGYLRGEYRALGVDFEERNPLFDEALTIIRGIWSTDDFAYEGLHFTARGQTANPKPGHLPVWIGGNSALSRRRVATSGDGWAPFAASATLAQTAKTPVLESVEDLKPMLDHLWAQRR
jgi:probable F420-dependent oxidoreductase